jgi:histidinol-phosphate phosphatase family protein
MRNGHMARAGNPCVLDGRSGSPSGPSADTSSRPAVFVDRDGTLNPDFHYLSDPDRYEFLPGVMQGLRLLREHGYRVICVTNQSGIGRGFFTEETLRTIHDRINGRLTRSGAAIDAFYYCPHRPEEGCACRKPGTELFLRAARDHHLDLSNSAIIGDRALDMEVGASLRLASVFVPERGLERMMEAELEERKARPDFRAGTFLGAALQLLGSR